MITPCVYIICGSYNELENTKKLLKCTKDQTYQNIKVIYVDDGSTDGTALYITSYHQDVILLKGDGKLWWTGILYKGIEKAIQLSKNNLSFILTVNADCTFDHNFIDFLVNTSQLYNRSIVGSLVVDVRDRIRIWDAGVRIDWSKGKFISIGPKDIMSIDRSKKVEDEIDTISTKGTLYPIEVFKKIGNFDRKNLPHYISDYEFGCRAKKAGFRLILSYQSIIYNDVLNTGFGEKIAQKISLYDYFQLLFSRKSRINIIDNIKFIKLCCPQKYKLKNYLFSILKCFFLFSYVSPLFYLKRLQN